MSCFLCHIIFENKAKNRKEIPSPIAKIEYVLICYVYLATALVYSHRHSGLQLVFLHLQSFTFHAAHLAFCLYFVSYYKRKMIYLEVNPETLTGTDFNVTFDQSGDDR